MRITRICGVLLLLALLFLTTVSQAGVFTTWDWDNTPSALQYSFAMPPGLLKAHKAALAKDGWNVGTLTPLNPLAVANLVDQREVTTAAGWWNGLTAWTLTSSGVAGATGPTIYFLNASNSDEALMGQSYNTGFHCTNPRGQIWTEWGLIIFNTNAKYKDATGNKVTRWTEGVANSDLRNTTITAAHEIGHQLRISHSGVNTDVMYKDPWRATVAATLTANDKKWANAAENAATRFTCNPGGRGAGFSLLSTETPRPTKAVLNYNLGTEPPTADPALATDTTSVDIDEAMFLGLTDLAEKDLAPVPELATSWDVSADGLEWTFHMRNDVPWVHCDPDTGEVTQVLDADGNPRIVNANEVVYGVKRTLNPNTGSDYAYVLYIIKGGIDLNTADPAADNFQELLDGVGVEALDDFTVKFTLRAPGGYFPQIASMWIARPMPEWVIDKYGDAWAEPGNIVTNAAFCMKEWVHEDHMVFVKNPFWFGWDLPDAGNIDEIHAVMVVEASTAYAMYLNDELDNVEAPQPEMDAIRADPVLSQELLIKPRGCTYYYGFVTNKPPVDNPDVRRALSMAIDRVTLINEVTKGNQLPANTFAPGMIFGNAAHDTDIAPWALPDSLGGWGYEDALAEAQRLMAGAGYPEGEGFEIVLMHNVSEGHARIAQAIQAMWLEAFPKAKFIVETMEWKVYLKAIQKESPLADMPHVFRLGWCLDYPDQNNWLHEVMNPEEGANRFRLSSDDPYVGDLIKEFSALTMQAGAEGDPDIRTALYKRAEKLASDDIAFYAPIYYYTYVLMVKPWLTRTYDDTNHWAKWSVDVAARGE